VQLPRLPPAPVRHLVRVTASCALANARCATDALALAVQDRRALAPTDAEPAPGDLVALTRPQCRALLATRSVGRLAYVARAGVPDIAPVNYELDGEDLLVRSGPGPKLQAAERGDVVAFEVDDLDERARSGWSVVVVGRARRVPAPADTAGPTPWSSGPRRHLVRITPTRVTGRRLA
jgi:hypothetical protein